jgi:membrane-associated phospholipid phosphatase
MVVEIYPLLNIFFRLATELGHEPFYITYFPFLVWNADTALGRHTVMVWCISMYVGQACKVLFKWKRPACPPAIRLVTNPVLETEYGLPSTHATVATTIPFYSLYFLYYRYNLSLWFGLPVALFWCLSVCLSRVYLGVHTVLDVLAGLLVAIIMLVLCLPAITYLDWFVFDFEYTLIAAPLFVILLLYVYPVEADKWSMDRGDTAAILGVGLGTLLGFHLHGRFPDDIGTGRFEVALPSLQVVGVSIVRFVVGVLLLLPTRFVMKLLCFRLLPLIMPTHGVQEVVKRPLVELPYKIITYSMISLNIIFSVYVFDLCNISRY